MTDRAKQTDPGRQAERARVRELEAEVCALEQRIEQRERMLKDLNHRLLQLERGENGIAGIERADVGQVLLNNQALQQQIDSMRQTKLFRWSAPARDVYARLRRLR